MPHGAGLRAEMGLCCKEDGDGDLPAGNGVSPHGPGLGHPKKSGSWCRILPRLGWGLLVDQGRYKSHQT